MMNRRYFLRMVPGIFPTPVLFPTHGHGQAGGGYVPEKFFQDLSFIRINIYLSIWQAGFWRRVTIAPTGHDGMIAEENTLVPIRSAEKDVMARAVAAARRSLDQRHLGDTEKVRFPGFDGESAQIRTADDRSRTLVVQIVLRLKDATDELAIPPPRGRRLIAMSDQITLIRDRTPPDVWIIPQNLIVSVFDESQVYGEMISSIDRSVASVLSRRVNSPSR